MRTHDVDLRTFYSQVANAVDESYYREPDPNIVYPFDGGYADPRSFPVDDFLRLSERVLRTQTAGALLYGGALDGMMYGYAGLREQLAARAVADDERVVDTQNVVLTSGGAQGISLAFEAFLDPGDAVVVEAPTWGMVLLMAQKRGAETIPVPLDDEGLDLDVLEQELARLEREGRKLKLVYTIAAFNTPTGVTLSLERRRRLLELSERYQFLILEDNVYRPLRYDGEPVATMFSMDDSGRVFKIESFSKTLAAGLRVGWVMGHRDVTRAIVNTRGDLGVGQWMSRMLAEYLGEGLLDPHHEMVNALYRRKRDAAEAALREYCSPWVTWRTPEGGFFLWVELDPAIDGQVVLEKAYAAGVQCRPGERFFGDKDLGKQFFRLAFSQVPLEDLERGIAVIGDVIAASKR